MIIGLIPSVRVRKHRGNDVGVLQERDKDEVEYGNERVSVPRSEVINAFSIR